jgi:hypothetical protein
MSEGDIISGNSLATIVIRLLCRRPGNLGSISGKDRKSSLLQNVYSSDFQPVCREGSAGVPREFGGRLKRSEKKLRNKKLFSILIKTLFFIISLRK